ncbi:MAG: CPBP family intramembrane glutamic endopeptidase [Bacteroidales bacterium]
MNKPPILHKFPVYLRLMTFGIIILSSVILVMMLGVVIAVPFFGTDVLKDLTNMGNSSNPDIVALAKYFQIVSQFGIFLVPSVLFAFLDGRNISAYLKINFKPAYKTMIIAAVLILTAVPLINFLAEINQQMKFPAFLSNIEQWMKESENKAMQLTNTFLNVSTLGGFFVNLLMIAVIPAIGEEFLFRGILQPLFQQWSKNIHIAVILSAFLFSAIHIQFYGFIPRFMMGILLGYVFVWSGSLWVPILVHFVNNSAAVIVSYFANKGIIDNTFETIGTGKSAIIPVLGSMIVSGVLIFMVYHFEKRIRRGERISLAKPSK